MATASTVRTRSSRKTGRHGRFVPRLEALEDRLAPAGALDLTFGADGKLTLPLSAGNDGVSAVVVQPDGKVVLAGFSDSGSKINFALVRCNADGTLDTSFG